MIKRRISVVLFSILLSTTVFAQPTPNWSSINAELLKHFEALVRIDTSDPPGNEAPAVEYLQKVLTAEAIEWKTFGIDPKRPNLIARLKGTGTKKPLLIMSHTDVVSVQPEKWKHPPFGAVREGPYIYGRGTVDDKDNLSSGLMIMLMLKRLKVPLDRDVIFLAEAGEEGSVQFGIKYLVENHWSEIEAEYCLAEGGGITRLGGKYQRISIGAAEKVPFQIHLVAKGTAGHGSVPLMDNALVQLSKAITQVAAWRTPIRPNDITRTYFERLGTVSDAEARARYNAIFSGAPSAEAAQDYLQANEPRHYSMLRTSISPNIVQGGYRINVIPSTAEATLDVRVAPGDTGEAILAEVRKLVTNSNVTVEGSSRGGRPSNPPSKLDTELYRTIEKRGKEHYAGAVVLPFMSTGATDSAFLRSKGVQCYGVGPAIDDEDGPKGYGAHSDQERILVDELYRFLRFQWDVVTDIVARTN